MISYHGTNGCEEGAIMPKPQNKAELYEAIDQERARLNTALEPLREAEMCQPGACGDWSVKDILAHLVDWEQRGLAWYRAGLQGEVPKLPDENYNWHQTPELNHAIYLKYKDFSLDDILKLYEESFKETMVALDGMIEEEMFSPRAYQWTGTHTLATFVNANTAAHYRWARVLIRKFGKNLKKQVG
jgi:hypothetical protein